MNELTHLNLVAFQKRYVLSGGTLARFRIRNRSNKRTEGEVLLRVRDTQANAMVRLKLHFKMVDEYRFQRRPGPGLVKLTDVRIGLFDDLIFINFDAFDVDGPPKVIDFRASDCFIAARRIDWEIVTRPAKG
jgi:hypothetical protein